jgi:hypothetical protein
VRLAGVHRTWLAELGSTFELAWASGWGTDANRLLCPFFDLPEYPIVVFPPVPFEPKAKVPAVAKFARNRAAAWIDDMLTPEAHAWAAARSAPTLLIDVDSSIGLTRRHVDRLQSDLGLGARRLGLVVGPKSVIPSGPPWRLGVSKPPAPRRSPDEAAR